jgi:hypothetical protein
VCVTMKGVSDLTDLLAELAADADEALRYDALAEAARQRVRARLPEARRRGAGPALLERTIKSLYVERTISRWTSGDVPEGEVERPKRKRPGAAPNGS